MCIRDSVNRDETLKKYTEPGTYWETDSEIVLEKGNKLKKDKSTLIDIIRADYRFIIDEFDYSYDKALGANSRIGARRALMGGDAVCSEYSDAMIAILRSQGIPARAALGYSNNIDLNNLNYNSIDSSVNDDMTEEDLAWKRYVQEKGLDPILHQWVQIWIPEYGWLTVDPTWGDNETGPKYEYIGESLQHILFYTEGEIEDDFVAGEILTADIFNRPNIWDNYSVAFESLTEEKYLEYEPLAEQLEYYIEPNSEGESIIREGNQMSNIEAVNTYIQTTIPGRIIISTLPICTSFIILIIVTSLIIRNRKRKARKSHPNKEK